MDTPQFVKKIIQRKRAGRTNADALRPRGNNRLVFKVSTKLHKACDAEAQRRHMTINALLRLLLSTIVRDRLFDAILGK